MADFLRQYGPACAVWLSVFFGAVLGATFPARLPLPPARRTPVSLLLFLAGGAAFGWLIYVVCFILLMVFSFFEDPDPWEVLWVSLVFQSVGTWFGAFLWRRGRSDRAGAPRRFATGLRPGPVATGANAASPRGAAPATAMQWLQGIAVLGSLVLVYAVAYAIMAPPYREKMVLMLWMQPAIGVAAFVEAWQEARRGLSRHEVAMSIGLGVIFFVASYVGLRLHYGLPVLPTS